MAGRAKQLVRYWTAGDLLGEPGESAERARVRWLREADPTRLVAWLREHAELDALARSDS